MNDDLNEKTNEELISIINDLKKLLNDEKFGLYFDRKSSPEDIVERCKRSIPVLHHIEDYDVINGGQENILIEGDNYACLEALNLINKNGLIDIICIDPPYNTGNDNFVFRDGFKHTDWLCMMERRLTLAKNILKDTGIIYIDIDDNEYAELKLLCDSIFGANNYLNDFIWLNNMKGRQISTGGAVKTYEHILLYAKNASRIPTFEGDIRELSEEMPMVYKEAGYEIMSDEKGKFIVKNELYNTNSFFNEETRPNLVFNIFYNPKTGEIKTRDTDEYNGGNDFVLIAPHKNSDGVHKFHAWRWSKEKIQNESYNLLFKNEGGEWKVYTKLRDIYSTNIKDVMSNSTNGNNELKNILGKKKFDYPKPVKLIKRLIKNYENILDEDGDTLIKAPEPIVILDFFAGSGTTGQAVLELNNEDEKKRIFILNTINEISEKTIKEYLKEKGAISKNINKTNYDKYKSEEEYKNFVVSEECQNLGVCQSVTLERLKTIVTGIRPDGSKYSEGMPATIRYFDIGFIDESEDDWQTRFNMAEHCDGLINILESTYDKISETNHYKIYTNNNRNKGVALFYEDYEKISFHDMLENLKKQNFKENVIYYFKQDEEQDSAIEKEAVEALPKARAVPIPSKMYDIHKHIKEESIRKY